MNTKEEALSLGHTTLKSNKLEGRPVVSLNYVSAIHELPLPYPDGDWYLRNTAVPAVRSGETVICSTLIPGLYDYYVDIGLIPPGGQIIQVEPKHKRDSAGNVVYGYPYTDPLAQLEGHVSFSDDSKPLIFTPTLNGALTEEQSKNLGLLGLNRLDSSITNNKATLRKMSELYGFKMLDGMIFEAGENMESVVQRFHDLPFGIWIKFPTGSGGDLVRHIREVNSITVKDGMYEIRAAVFKSFREADFDTPVEYFWPEDSLVNPKFPYVIEADVRNFGKLEINGSTQFITDKSGQHFLVGHFEQITSDEGEYLGNRPLIAGQSQMLALVEQEAERVAEFSVRENKYFGIQGVDWFLVKKTNGDQALYIVELNSRPTANTPPVIIAEKLCAEHWINTNVYSDKPIHNIKDYINLVGADLAYGGVAKGLVIPQSFRTLVTRNGVAPSPNFKALILGDSREKCDLIMSYLSRRGLRFSP